ncbi:MAG: hypothetical protein V4644_00245 [Patescibacteria group bacterium]
MPTTKRRYSRRYAPDDIEHQIDVFRAQWPRLQPDQALSYIRYTLPELPKPEGAEAPFVFINPSFFGTRLRAVREMLDALEHQRRHRGNFKDFCSETFAKDELTERHLKPRNHTLMAEKAISRKQPGDLWIVHAQFGDRHAGRSSAAVRDGFGDSEFGLGILAVGGMILTHRSRFVHKDGLQAECVGDRFAIRGVAKAYRRAEESEKEYLARSTLESDQSFGATPYFGVNKGSLILDAISSDFACEHAGSVTGFVPSL